MCAVLAVLLLVALTIGGVLHGGAGYGIAAFCAAGLVLVAASNYNPGETGYDPTHRGT